MTITAEEVEVGDMVEEEEVMVAAVTVVDVMIMAVAVVEAEVMVAAVTVSFCLYPHQSLYFLYYTREINVLTAYKTLRNLQVVVDMVVDGIILEVAEEDMEVVVTVVDIKHSPSMHYRVRQ